MKLIHLTFLFVLFVSFQSLSAQSKLTEGVLYMELTEVDADDPEAAGMLSGMRGSTQDIYFSTDKQKVIMNMMGGLISTTSITDAKAKESRTYMDMMGQKIVVKSPYNAEENGEENLEIKYDPSKNKTIHGYKCKYAAIVPKVEGAEGTLVEIYYTEDIQLLGSVSSQINTSAIKGAPLEMAISAQGFKMKYETKKIGTSLDKDAFKEPTGYKEMTQEEFEKMMGGFNF